MTKIGFAADTLASVINDVLDLSKVESGEMTLEELPLNLPALLAEVVAVLGPTASERGVDLRLDLGDGLPASVIGDATRLRQIITNLVGNAIKFTDPGGSVRASLTCVGRTAGTVRLRLSVADTGIGIAADAQERLFDPFTQAETGTTRAHGGTGLGLSIVQRLVTMMSGEVGVQSELGVGSEFWVEVPLRL
ncbi:MAG: hypothetical protein KC547_24000, partial [Anaerolineae bacterium]|nr:hypothetical protein [Anaerolineae bacterium]